MSTSHLMGCRQQQTKTVVNHPRSGNVGGPVVSVDTVGVLPAVGWMVTIGAGEGGRVLHISMY